MHIPFCIKKCAYCDFLSAPADRSVQFSYVKRLTEEIQYYGSRCGDYEVTSVFFGGGTPTVLTGEELCTLLSAIRTAFHLREDAEITTECNPGTLDLKKARALKKGGFNRLSLGLQSAQDEELKMLGRIHTWQQFLESFAAAREAGFSNINVDLMSALPRQTPDTWTDTLRKVLPLSPEHISAYSLILEEGTPFYEIYHEEELLRSRGEEVAQHCLPSEEEEREMYAQTGALLLRHGYERYEISNYARRGYACRHNLGYWQRENYLGLGLGASSLMENVRFQNTSSLSRYLSRPFSHEERELLTRQAQMEEFMFLGLRLTNGVSGRAFLEQFGEPVGRVYGETLRRLEGQGLLRCADGRIFLTDFGRDVSNTVLAEFLL